MNPQFENDDKKVRERSRDKENEKEVKDAINLTKSYKNRLRSRGFVKQVESEYSFLQKYHDMNIDYYKNNLSNEQKSKIDKIFNENVVTTEQAKAKKLGNELFSIINTLTKQDNKLNNKLTPPNLEFYKTLSDEEFINLVREAKNFALVDKTKSQLIEIENLFKNNEENIKSMFFKTKITKDIIQNAILSILISEYDQNELEKNISFLSVNEASNMPLINIKFESGDLNKKILKEIASSKIALYSYDKNMKIFFKNYNLKKFQLKECIEQYINKHQIYFVSLNDDIQGLVIHTGDIFINLKYIKEYFEPKNKVNHSVIKAKIILVFLHELNHGLLRDINTDMKKNFFISSKRNKKIENLKFKGMIKGETYILSPEESGNNFDFILYGGYYLDKINLDIAELFFSINKYDNKREFNSKLKEIISKAGIIPNSNVFKFKKSKNRNAGGGCLWSILRMSQVLNDKNEIKEKEV